MDPNMSDLVGRNGRLNYKGLVSLIKKASQPHFVSYCDHPFLVGKDLITGDFSQPNSADGTHTMSFSPQDILSQTKEEEAGEKKGEAGSGGSSISRAIYVLTKGPMSDTPRNVFSIGRVAGNDVVIADYSVSKSHAHISVKKGSKYFLSDVHSTNGTFLEGEKLTPEKEVELGPNNEIIFGRLEFVFTSPGDLYSMMNPLV